MFSFFVNEYESIQKIEQSIEFGDFSLITDAYTNLSINRVSVIGYLNNRRANYDLSTVVYNTINGKVGGALILGTRKMEESSLVNMPLYTINQKDQNVLQAEAIELLGALCPPMNQSVRYSFANEVLRKIRIYVDEHRECKYLWLECTNYWSLLYLKKFFGFKPLYYNDNNVLWKEIKSIEIKDIDFILRYFFIKRLPPFGTW